MSERPILLCRWKPYFSVEDTLSNNAEILRHLDPEGPLLYSALPYPYRREADQSQFSDQLLLGIDNMLNTIEGSYASHFAVKMLQDAQAGFVLLGDREAREVLGEEDAVVSQKILSALEAGLRVIACVGDTKAGGVHGLEAQLQGFLGAIPAEQLPLLSLVYQGPWPVFYKGAGLANDLLKGLDTMRQVISIIVGESGAQIPVLLALPSHLRHCDAVIEATGALCAGYYFPHASSNPALLVEVGEAWHRWATQPPPLPEPEPEPSE